MTDEAKAEPVEQPEEVSEQPDEPTATEPDLESLSEDDLRGLIDQRAHEADDARFSEGPADEPEPEAVESPAEEAPAEAQQEATPGDAPAEIPIDELEQQLEEANRQVTHFKKVAGREAGRSGYLERELKEMRSLLERLQARPTDDLGTGGYDPAEAPSDSRVLGAVESLNKRIEAVTSELNQQAIRDVGAQFLNVHPDADTEVQQAVFELLKRDHLSDFEALAASDDPTGTRKRAAELIESAYWQVKRDRLSADLELRQKAKADQAASLRERKLAAAPAQTGGGKAAPKPRTRNLEDLSPEELRKEIDRRARAAP